MSKYLEDFEYATDSETDRDEAALEGSKKPGSEWILSDRDVWYSNPYYTGKPTGTHPEDPPPLDELDSLGIGLYFAGQEACRVKGCLPPPSDLPF